LDFLLADFNSTTFSLNPNPNYHEKTGKNWVADSFFRNLLEAILFRVQEEEVLLSVPNHDSCCIAKSAAREKAININAPDELDFDSLLLFEVEWL
jgi:hypothetical protein